MVFGVNRPSENTEDTEEDEEEYTVDLLFRVGDRGALQRISSRNCKVIYYGDRVADEARVLIYRGVEDRRPIGGPHV